MYITGRIFGGILKCYFYAIFSENLWCQTKRFTELLELVQLYKQNPFEKFFIFTIYQNYTLALKRSNENDEAENISILHQVHSLFYPFPNLLLTCVCGGLIWGKRMLDMCGEEMKCDWWDGCEMVSWIGWSVAVGGGGGGGHVPPPLLQIPGPLQENHVNVNQMDKGKQLNYWFMLRISRGLHAHDAEKQKKGFIIPKVHLSENEIRFVNPKIKYCGRITCDTNCVVFGLTKPF